MNTERAERLRAWVKRFEGVPVTFGSDDCSAWVARWVEDETGWAIPRPEYDSEDAAHALIASERGGLLRIWKTLARDAGLQRHYSDDPGDLGDVGLIDTSRGPVGGIWANNGVFCWRHERGVRMIAPRMHTIIATWELP